MKRTTKIVFHILILLLFITKPFSINAQDKRKKLEKTKQRIEQEIAYTSKLLKETKKSKAASLNQLIILNNQVEKREELLKIIKNEVAYINTQIKVKSQKTNELENEIKKIKEEYAKLIYFAYKNREAYNRIMFIFSASDFNQAYKRMKYLQQYNEYRKKQAELLKQKQLELSERLEALRIQKKTKNDLLAKIKRENKTLLEEKEAKNEAIEDLKSKEMEIVASLKEKEAEARKLKRAIEKLIEAEMRKKSGSKKTAGAKFKLTPEEAELSKTFSRNRGKLPWPSEKGILTSTYGVHAHPVLPGIKTKNNGINIATNEGAKARVLFDGTVKSILTLARNNNAIIVMHGEYYTVYTNISNVFVKKGQKVTTKQEIGTVYTDSEDSKTELHLEIWKGNKTLNPINWLVRMN